MEYISELLRDNFEYEVRQFSPKEYSEGKGLSELDVLKAHYILSDYFLKKGETVRFGLLNFGMLSSAVGRQYVEFGGRKKWNDDYHKIATLLYGLTMDHAFHDGNKRTALLSALWYLNKINREVQKKTIPYLEALVVDIAAHGLNERRDFKKYGNVDDPEIRFIADKLKSWTRQVDKRMYTITYNELNTRLKQYGFYLDKPSGNHIGIYKKRSGVFSLFRDDLRLGSIGFPGWKNQVSSGDLKRVLSLTQLDSDHGIDSVVFFKDATPSYELLQQYNAPLKRLKDL